MAHIDLYQSFGLDRAAGCEKLAQQLDARIASTGPGDAVLREQLTTAQAILGSPQRRAIYDGRLADPGGPPLDTQALHELAGLPGSPMMSASAPRVGPPPSAGTSAASGTGGQAGWLPTTKVLLAIVAVLVVAVIAAVTALVISRGPDSDQTAAPTDSPNSSEPARQSGAPASTDQPTPPAAPVAGAYPGAGGPRPASAAPLPTYVSRYGKLESAHLLTPTGGIGCDFSTQNEYTRQGQCGVRSMNTTSSPFGTEKIGGTDKGRWLFQLSNDRVGEPVGNTGTTGWMNQPLSDGYQVPRVQYGKQYYFQDWAIASEMNGLTVWNTTTGSGIFLSNEKVEKFDGPGGSSPPARDDEGAEPVVLGSMPSNGTGYGSARPTEIYAGGSPTSRITGITWSDWGGAQAVGTGTGVWREDGRVGREQYIPATVVASDIGTCNGKRAYLKIVWYFPSKGETADAGREMKTCWDR
ncbi:hypothetical protein SAMN04488550_0603 [Gordonia malaquae]|uniref:Uncharacterized protein n=1 Tax=Gordonia malaquae NBRC 108250 TaxID=1223542 RepID=M3VGE1_GORML|nr:hypothetical protein [Gordonia malaquae]GAC80834.1 hypothetical protein GM1_022_00450 [Gordonia malaquae NBRC 108250]SEB67834.1 hypothetical protein SAMN04488550_0603 [Gordonia malaquae]